MPESRVQTLRDRLESESGISMIEVLVSSIVIVLASLAGLGAIDAATGASADQRDRAVAHGLAQQDQARLRSLSILELGTTSETRTVEQNGTSFQITSTGQFVSDDTGTSSCEQGSSADYVRISSSIDWSGNAGRPPVELTSIVSPPAGSTTADEGALAISVVDAGNNGIAGISISGSGAGTFSGTTGPNGCLLVGGLPEGDYTITPDAPGKIDADGDQPDPMEVSVIGLSTNTVVLQFDDPGSAAIDFVALGNSGVEPVDIEQLVAYHTGMTEARVFGEAGSPASSITATNLFPFESDYSFYAGSCEYNNPNPDNDYPPPASVLSLVIDANETAVGTIQVPTHEVVIWSGSSGSPGSQVSGGTVKYHDIGCSSVWSFQTGAGGTTGPNVVPAGWYFICASDGSRRRWSFRRIEDIDTIPKLNSFMQGWGSESGTC